MSKPDIVGMPEIATRLEVARITVTKWRERGLGGVPFPEPDGYLSGHIPWWTWRRVASWASKVGGGNG